VEPKHALKFNDIVFRMGQYADGTKFEMFASFTSYSTISCFPN